MSYEAAIKLQDRFKKLNMTPAQAIRLLEVAGKVDKGTKEWLELVCAVARGNPVAQWRPSDYKILDNLCALIDALPEPEEE